MPPCWVNAHGGRAIRSRVGLATTLLHPYEPQGFLARPLSHRQETFCCSIKSWGQVDIFL